MALTKIKADGLTADLIDETKLADNSIDSEHYNDGSIDTAHIADSQVTTAKIADNAVDMNKLSDLDNGRIIARVSSGSGNPEAATAAQVRTLLNVADGATNSPTTTINNNADNRVITGSGTANTLEGEDKLTWNGNNLHIERTVTSYEQPLVNIYNSGAYGWGAAIRFSANWANTEEHQATLRTYGGSDKDSASLAFNVGASGSEKLRILPTGGITFNGDTAVANALDDYEKGTWTPLFQYWDGSGYQDVTFDDSLNYTQGHYVKIGDLVHIWYYSGQFSTDGTMNNASARITGLPYVFKNSSPYYGGIFHFIHTNCFKDDAGNIIDCHGAYSQYNTNAFYPSIGASSGQAKWGSESGRYLMLGGTYHSNT